MQRETVHNSPSESPLSSPDRVSKPLFDLDRPPPVVLVPIIRGPPRCAQVQDRRLQENLPPGGAGLRLVILLADRPCLPGLQPRRDTDLAKTSESVDDGSSQDGSISSGSHFSLSKR
jgi:hypothetical protein